MPVAALLVTAAGLPLTTAVLVGSMLQVGGVTGVVAMGPFIDRVGFRKLPVFPVAAVAIVGFGLAGRALRAADRLAPGAAAGRRARSRVTASSPARRAATGRATAPKSCGGVVRRRGQGAAD